MEFIRNLAKAAQGSGEDVDDDTKSVGVRGQYCGYLASIDTDKREGLL
jgi:hypothetical protein